MLTYFFIPIILYSFIKIIIMTIFICFSLYVREMFCFKQISSHYFNNIFLKDLLYVWVINDDTGKYETKNDVINQ